METLAPQAQNQAAEESQVLADLQVLIPDIRQRRLPVENEWLLNHAAWRAVKTRFYYTEGVSDHYIPAARRAVERFVTRLRAMLIPAPDFFEVYPVDELNPMQGLEAEHAKAYLAHVVYKRLKLRSFVDQLARSFLLYNRAIAKVTVQVVDQPVIDLGKVDYIKQVWPTARVVDPFSVYVWPETATSIDEAQIIFEDNMMPYEDYVAHSEAGVCKPIAKKDLGRPEWPRYHSQRLNVSGLSEPTTTSEASPTTEGAKPIGSNFVALSEVWFKKAGRWKQAWIVWNETKPRIVRYNASPYPEPPYLMTLARSLPGEHYTTGMMSDLEPLQVWLNDQVNLTQDAQFTIMSPPVMVNPMSVFDKGSLTFRPRAKWLVDPAGIMFPNLPDTTKAGIGGVQMVLGFMDTFSGSNPLAEGQPTRGMPRAGFAVSSLIQLSMSDIKGAAELLEDEILSPMLAAMYRIAVMFTPQQQRLLLPPSMGMPGREITIKELYGDHTFKWVGSLQAQDFQVRAQRLVTFMGILTKAAPMIQQSGLQIDWKTLTKRIWREGLGERGAETILRDMTDKDVMALLAVNTAQGKGPIAGMLQSQDQTGFPGAGPGEGAPVPATAEQSQRQMSSQMTNSAIGQSMAGTGQG